MKQIKFFLIIGFSFLILTSCASYNDIVPDWATICSKPTNKKDAAWYNLCNYKNPEFKPIFKN